MVWAIVPQPSDHCCWKTPWELPVPHERFLTPDSTIAVSHAASRTFADTRIGSSTSHIVFATRGSGGPYGMPPAPPTKPAAKPTGDGASQSTSLTSSAVCWSGPAAPPPAPRISLIVTTLIVPGSIILILASMILGTDILDSGVLGGG